MRSRIPSPWIPLLNGGVALLTVLALGWEGFRSTGHWAWWSCSLAAEPILQAARSHRQSTGRFPANVEEVVAAAPPEAREHYRSLLDPYPGRGPPLRYVLKQGVPRVAVRVPTQLRDTLELPVEFVYWEGQEPPPVQVPFLAWVRSGSFGLSSLCGAVIACIVGASWWIIRWFYAAVRGPEGPAMEPPGPWGRALRVAGTLCVTAPIAWVVAVTITSLASITSH